MGQLAGSALALHPQPLTVAHALARVTRLIRMPKKSDIPEKPKTPAAVVHPREEGVSQSAARCECPAKGWQGEAQWWQGDGRSAGHGAGEQEREAPPQGWAAWTGPGPAGRVRACVCVCEPVPSPAPRAQDPPPLPSPPWPVGGHSCDLLWPEGGGEPLCPPPLPLPPPPGSCLCVSWRLWFAGPTKGGEGLPGEAVVSALGQKEAGKWIHKALEQRKSTRLGFRCSSHAALHGLCPLTLQPHAFCRRQSLPVTEEGLSGSPSPLPLFPAPCPPT